MVSNNVINKPANVAAFKRIEKMTATNSNREKVAHKARLSWSEAEERLKRSKPTKGRRVDKRYPWEDNAV